MATWTPTPEKVSEMVDRIVRAFDPEKVILFGSLARGDDNEDSDVDLLVVLDDIENKHDAAVAILRVLGDMAVCKDIVVTTPEEISRRGDAIGSVLRPALREGKVLYERS
jgi:predicted nucleotidyltransferase